MISAGSSIIRIYIQSFELVILVKNLKTKLTHESIHSQRTPFVYPLEHQHILNSRLDSTNYEDSTQRIINWAISEKQRYICVANVHMIMEAHINPRFRKIVNSADLVTPDGMPLVWTMRMLGLKNQTRVYGPTLTLHVCKAASKIGLPVGFYGGSPTARKNLVQNISSRFASLRIAYNYSPPFRPLKAEEDKAAIQSINNSRIKILFVGLGCPKQEHWMFNHLGKINAVMIGVGTAFDFHAGIKKQAPSWIMAIGLEWLFRLCHEPRRLWRRYLYNNPRYLFLVARQILRERQLRN
jgi:N-acetylglucosaminyldiphosphoundecaprenol N-acetyl-beta-D-mannosaminyltransferase